MKLLFSILFCLVIISGFGQGGFLGKKRGIDIDVAELALYQNIRPTVQIALSRQFALIGSISYGQKSLTDVIDYSEFNPNVQFDQHETRFAWRIGAQVSYGGSDNYAPLGLIYKFEVERFINQRTAKPLFPNALRYSDTTSASEYVFTNKGIILSWFCGVSKNIGTNFYYCWGFDFGLKFGTLSSPNQNNIYDFRFSKSSSYLANVFAVWPDEGEGFYIMPYAMPRVRFGFMF